MFLLKAAEMKEADRQTIEKIGIPGMVLMENAGIAVVRALNEQFPPDEMRKIIVFCGKGNNGGDGFVVARHLFLAGDEVETVLLGGRKNLTGDAAANMKITQELGIPLLEISEISDLENAGLRLDDYNIIIDALFGTGIQKPAEGLFAYVIELINNSVSYVVSVDIPTGLDADTGELIGPAVEADLTVTFAYPKICHILPPAEGNCGELIVADISIPDDAVRFEKGKREILTPDLLEGSINPREADSHKGDYGHLFVIAGSMGKMGAASMAAASASRSGAGLVTVITPALCIPVIQTKLTQEMALGLEDEGKGYFTEKNADAIPLLEKHTALAIGPGLGRNEETFRFVRKILEYVTVPTILDADGLNAFQDNTGLFSAAKAPLILTPHPGEFSRLTGADVQRIQANRLDMAAEYAGNWKVFLILKGYRTVVATPDGDLYVNLTGNPGMAKGGSGDVLTGIIGGLLASGVEPLDAALLGVYVHGLAGDIASSEKNELCMTSNDLMESISSAFDIV